MLQSGILALFPTIPRDKLPIVADALNMEIMKLDVTGGAARVRFMTAMAEGEPYLRAEITSASFSALEKMSDKVEELFARLGGVVEDRKVIG